MRTLITLICCLGLLALMPSHLAAADKPSKASGEITAISEDSITIKVKAKKKKGEEGEAAAEEVTAAINEETVITVNGEAATATDVKAGEKAQLMVKDGTATKIAVGKAAKKGKKDKKAKKPKKKEAEGGDAEGADGDADAGNDGLG